MLDWDDLRYLLAVQRTGSLSRAGTSLGINATTVGRRLTALEEGMNARLFDRTPEGFVLTAAGRELLPRAERMEAEAIAVEREIVGADLRTQGSVRVTATEMLATRFIAPHLPRFREAWPGVTLELECTHRTVSLARREADVALRLARPREDNIVARRLASIPLALYASPAYLERYGTPEDAELSLAGHALLLFPQSRLFSLENEWLAPRLEGATIALRSDSVSSLYAAALSGLGLGLLPRAVADFDPALRRIETRTAPSPRVIWQAVHEDLQRSGRVRVVLDFLAEILMAPGECG